MNENEFNKDPEARLDYKIDWTEWLGDDIITASTWSVPAGITKELDTWNNQSTTIWLSGGSLDCTYECVNHIETADGREDDRTILIHVIEK